MQESDAYNANTVFAKSGKGREEIASRCHGLNPHQRRLLIVFDGKKDLKAIADMMSASELAAHVSFLIREGFLCEVEAAVAHPPPAAALPVVVAAPAVTAHAPTAIAEPRLQLVPTQAPPEAAPQSTPAPSAETSAEELRAALTEDPETIRQVKDFMTTTAHTYLGLLGAPVIQRIERARDAAQLMSVVGHWHMALRESKQGHRFAGPYMIQVQQSLTGSAPVALQAQA
jgi:hypothetical protein